MTQRQLFFNTFILEVLLGCVDWVGGNCSYGWMSRQQDGEGVERRGCREGVYPSHWRWGLGSGTTFFLQKCCI